MPWNDSTHPPTGPVEGTLEHRPQLAVDIEAFFRKHSVMVGTEMRTITD